MLPIEEPFDKKLQQAERAVQKFIKKANLWIANKKEILNQCIQWQQVYHTGILLQSNLFRIEKGMSQIVIADWEQGEKEVVIPLDPYMDIKDQLKQIFKKSKKLQSGIPHAERELKRAEKELSIRTEQLSILQKVSSPEELNSFCLTYHLNLNEPSTTPKRSPAKKEEAAKPYRVYKTIAGLEIWVGKSAKDNDKLSFHHANGLDWWLHAHNYPGSHVVIRGTRGEEPDLDSLYDAAELALRFSKNTDTRGGEVSLTQVKAIKSVKNTPGKVMLSKYRMLKIKLDNNRWNRLRGSPTIKPLA